MSERVLEIAKFVSPLLGIILGAIASYLVNRFLSLGVITLGKWGSYILVGVGGILGAVLVDYLYTGNINYWWGAAGFFIAVCICWICIQYFAYPYKRFRVTCLEDDDKNVLKGKKDGKGLIANKQRGECNYRPTLINGQKKRCPLIHYFQALILTYPLAQSLQLPQE